MKILLVHPGTQHAYKLARELYLRGYLYKFCTRFSLSSQSKLSKMISQSVQSKIQNRIIDLPSSFLYTTPWKEMQYQYAIKRDKPWYVVQYEMHEEFQKAIPDELFQECDIVIGYDTSSHILVQRARQHGKKFILDRTIGHPSAQADIFRLLHQLYPDWRSNMPIKEANHIAYEQFEHNGADLIVVPSQFVKETMIQNGVSENKLIINPFGTNLDYFSQAYANRKLIKDRLNFLFFGSVTARKGVPTLLEAWSKMQPTNANLILAGYGEIPATVTLPDKVSFLGPIAASARAELFTDADVFVFPSFFEGFAQVQIEAAASGLPLITTSNAGGDEIVINNENGILIEPGNVASLINAMRYFTKHPELISEMGNRSRQIALEKFSWHDYGERWNDILKHLK